MQEPRECKASQKHDLTQQLQSLAMPQWAENGALPVQTRCFPFQRSTDCALGHYYGIFLRWISGVTA